jgi:hypothetical protein
MALCGQSILAFWNNVQEGSESEFTRWHVAQHIPERLAIPGFLRGRRYVAAFGFPRFFNFYEAESKATFTSAAYLERLNDPTEWTTAVVATFTDTSRTICDVRFTSGIGVGAWMATVRFSFDDNRGEAVSALRHLLAEIADQPGLVGAHLITGALDAPTQRTRELELRGREDDRVDGVIFVEAAEPEMLSRLISSYFAEATLRGLGLGSIQTGLYQLQYSLTSDDVQP